MNIFLIKNELKMYKDEILQEAISLAKNENPDDNIIVMESEEELEGSILMKTIIDKKEQILNMDDYVSRIRGKKLYDDEIVDDLRYQIDSLNYTINKIQQNVTSAQTMNSSVSNSGVFLKVSAPVDLSPSEEDFLDEINDKKSKNLIEKIKNKIKTIKKPKNHYQNAEVLSTA